ncbi:hypothetical protein RN001_001489 [Aquatica leii]|uniref:Uncharacterized protein n=1 Tax=Aquatica leii TaxID=1421715 RepID=A0AAN7PGC1_9COLE|nr:hypothetical protein RN001_001489 [Aquatica leii]
MVKYIVFLFPKTIIAARQQILDRHKGGEETLQLQIHNSPASTSTSTTHTAESSFTEFFWSDAETTLLIFLYNDHKDAFTNVKNENMYEKLERK